MRAVEGRRRAAGAALLAGALAGGWACRSEQPPPPRFLRAPDAPFVATPEDVVEQMLRLAAVTERDLVYDLGSGDGRIVIAAAKTRGARGVGIELDSKLVEVSRRRAREEGVADRVQFVQADLFRANIRPATVVTAYLLPDMMLALARKLRAELAPGTRIVSLDFGMGDWAPERTVRYYDRVLYLWVVAPGGDQQPAKARRR